MFLDVRLTCILLLCFHFGVSGLEIECNRNFSASPNNRFPYPEKVDLGKDYEATIRYTNWADPKAEKATAKYVERNINGSLVVSKTTRGATFEWIKTPGRFVYHEVNTTQSERGHLCTGAPSEGQRNVYELSASLAKFLNVDGSNLSAILNSVVSYKNYNAARLEPTTNITSGVETVGWLGCAKNFSGDDTSLQVNVLFAGDKSQQPYNAHFNNPQVMTFHLQLYKESNATEVDATEHVSFDIVALDKIDLKEGEKLLTPPRGIYCSDLPVARIPHDFPDRFEASLDFVNTEKRSVDSVDILFDEAEHIFSFGLDFQDDQDIPFVTKNTAAFKESARIVHDFKYGLQYTLSKDEILCQSVKPIDKTLGDVLIGENGTLSMRNPAEIFFNITDEKFYYAGKVHSDGQQLDSYVSKKEDSEGTRGNYIVVEALYSTDKWKVDGIKSPLLHSIVQYHRNKNDDLIQTTAFRLNSLKNNSGSYSPWGLHNVYPCLPTAYTDDNFLFVKIKNASLTDLKKVGLEQAESAIIEAVAHHANISVLRVTSFMFKQLHKQLLACFQISEKSGVENPAKTAYLQKELSADEAREALNDTIKNGSMSMTIDVRSGGRKVGVTLFVDQFGRLPAHETIGPHPPDRFGYTGQAMFVLGLFMFIFGAGIVVTGYVFYVKRQSIRGMAYQVFE